MNPQLDQEFQKYKQFAFNKNMAGIAVGLMLATAFQKTVTGISDFILMPVVNYFLKQTSTNWREMTMQPVAGMNIELGHFLGVFLDFVVLSLVLYLVYFKVVKRIWPDAELSPTPAPPVPEKPPEATPAGAATPEPKNPKSDVQFVPVVILVDEKGRLDVL